MSKLAPLLELTPPEPTAPPFRLKSRRRRTLHPEQIEEKLRDKARTKDTSADAAPFGWLLRLYHFDGHRSYRKLPPGTSYPQALHARDAEMKSGRYEKCWLERKIEP